MLAASGAGPGRREAFLARFLAEIESPDRLALDRLLPGAVAALAALAARGDRLVLLSLRRDPAAFAGQVARLRIAERFARVDAGRTSADDRVAKRRLIEAAGVTTGLRNRRVLLAAGADAVVDRTARVPAALDGVRAHDL